MLSDKYRVRLVCQAWQAYSNTERITLKNTVSKSFRETPARFNWYNIYALLFALETMCNLQCASHVRSEVLWLAQQAYKLDPMVGCSERSLSGLIIRTIRFVGSATSSVLITYTQLSHPPEE